MRAGLLFTDDSALRLRPGRSFAFSPAWRDDGVSVLFDRDSGDYWVVSTLARALVGILVNHDGLCAEDVVNRALRDGADEAECTQEAGMQVLAELVRLDIVALAPRGATAADVVGGGTLA